MAQVNDLPMRNQPREAPTRGRHRRTGGATQGAAGGGSAGAGSAGAGEEVQDTRSRIQSVALELFIEQGYEQTSLREIAERLGVTKAALYYHFRTKDEIVQSFTEDRLAAIERLIAWARSQPSTVETKREFLRRYSEELRRGRQADVMRFFERNQTSMKGMRSAEQMRERMTDILSVLSTPADPLPVRIKSSLALFSLHATWFVIREPEITDDQRLEAALLVALELLE
jgi:AcrR family transcriptional regulator